MYFYLKKRMLSVHLGQQHRENIINAGTAVRLKTTRNHSVARFWKKNL